MAPRSSLPREGYGHVRALVPERLRAGMRTSEDFHEYLSARVSRRSVLKTLGIAGAAAAIGPSLWAKPGSAAEPPQGLHLAYGDDPRTSMSVSWRTPTLVSKPVLEVGQDSGYGLRVEALSTTYPGLEGETISIQHHATIEGLEPGKAYHYRVRHEGAQSEDFTFTTAPDVIAPFTFTTFGDHGSAPTRDTRSATWGTAFSPLAVAAIEALDPAFHLHAGDLSYSCGGPQDAWDVWFDEITPRASKMPWMATLGNHEMEIGYGPDGYDPFRSRLRWPSNGVNWTPERTSTFYAFQYSNVLVVALDGNEAASERGYHFNRGYLKGAQDRWLAATLKAARANPTIDWIVASFHNCMYCTDAIHASDGGCRARWQRLFEKYRVDVVVNGHNHCYERAYPILDGAHTPLSRGQAAEPETMGVTYVCAGGGGQVATPRSASTFPIGQVNNEDGERENEDAAWRAARHEGYSIVVAEVDPGTPAGKTTLTLITREFETPARAELDRIVLERPAKAILAGKVGGAAPKPEPKPKPPPKVGGVKRELPATGIGAGNVAAGVGALAGAALLTRLNGRHPT